MARVLRSEEEVGRKKRETIGGKREGNKKKQDKDASAERLIGEKLLNGR